MAGERGTLSPSEDERKDFFGRLAKIADRSIRPVHIKPVMDTTVKMLRENLLKEDASLFSMVVQGLTRCGIALPQKAPIYATIVGVLSAGEAMYSKPLAKKVAGTIAGQFIHAIRDGRASLARRAFRFLVCLSLARVVSIESICAYLRTLLETAVHELTSANRSPKGVHARGQFFADIAISSLPWCGPAIAELAPEELEGIMELVNKIFSSWNATHWLSIASASPSMSEPIFQDIMKAVRELEENEWSVPESLIPNLNAEYTEELADGQLIELTPVAIPSHSKRAKYAPPRFRLRLIEDSEDIEMSDSPAKPAEPSDSAVNSGKGSEGELDAEKSDAKSSKGEDVEMNGDTNSHSEDVNLKKEEDEAMLVSRAEGDSSPVRTKESKSKLKFLNQFVKMSYVEDVLDNFSTKHMMAAERLLTMPMLNDSNNQIVEGLFSQMCAMPMPPFSCVYYGILFVDLCKVKDSRLPVKLLSAVETIFQQSGELDPETFDRLTDWFSFHLSNFGYKWNWSDWAVYADADMEDKFPFRALFCRDVLKRSMRLSYYDKIANLVPEEMKFFLPRKPTNGNSDRFDPEVNKVLMEIVTGSGKQPPEVVKEKLFHLFPPSTNEDEDEKEAENKAANLARLSALIRSVLKAGYKTLSHFDTVAERYISLLLEMSNTGGVDAKQLLALEASVFWDSSHLRRMYVLDKLSTTGVIDWFSILNCVLSKNRVEDDKVVPKKPEEVAADLANSETWELVRLVLSRAMAREEGARLELTTATQLAAAATEGDAEAMEGRLERAKNATAHAVQEIKKCLHLILVGIFGMSEIVISADSEAMVADDAEDNFLPGLNGAPLWAWRAMGMIRELGRKYPRHIGDLLEALRVDVSDMCEQHRMLGRSLYLLEELAGSDVMHYAL